MKHRQIFLLLINCFFMSASFAQASEQYPVFVLNDSFSHVQPKHSKLVPRNYELKSPEGFRLDCSKYDFSEIRKLNKGKDPDKIFIISKTGNYWADFNPGEIKVIDAGTLHSLKDGSKSFTGFTAGDTPILSIGTFAIRDSQSRMLTYWMSMIDVK